MCPRTVSREEIRTDTPDVMGARADANWELERERELLRRERESDLNAKDSCGRENLHHLSVELQTLR